jgi:lipopolysaccharide export system protein LptA
MVKYILKTISLPSVKVYYRLTLLMIRISKYKVAKLILSIFMICSFTLKVLGQQNAPRQQIIIENADKHIIDNTTTPSTKFFNGNVRAFHNGSFFYCDSAVVIENTMNAYGNVTIIQNDTINTFSDELFYEADSSYAYLKGKVVLKNKKDELFTEYLEYDLSNKIAYYKDKALLKSEKNELKSRKGEYYLNEKLANFYDRVSVQGEDFFMVTDTLKYNTESGVATWFSPALITQDTATIYSQTGKYQTKEKKADFIGKAQYKKNDVIARGHIIKYDGQNKSVALYKDSLQQAQYYSEKDSASADSILYFEATDNVNLIGKAKFKNPSYKANGDKINYNKKDDSIDMEGRGTIQDSTNTLTADDVNYNKVTKLGIAIGAVIWNDTASKTSIICDTLNIDGGREYLLARNKKNKPQLKSLIDTDTFYLSSNLIERYKSIEKIDSFHSDTNVIIKAMGNMELINGNLQAISDSMTFNQTDSIFTLYSNPFMWIDTTQLKSDTLKIFMKDKKVSKLEMIDNGLLITSPDLYYFNQIAGNNILIYFEEKNIKQLIAEGNSQCTYYILDKEDAYIGVSQNESSRINFNFKDKKIDNIRFYTEPKSTLSPMDKVDHDKIKLKGFLWNNSNRPKGPLDLLD